MVFGRKGGESKLPCRCFLAPLSDLRCPPIVPPANLRSSIMHFGILQPLVVAPRGSTYIVLEGRKRFQVARELGIERVPVLCLESKGRKRDELGTWHPALASAPSYSPSASVLDDNDVTPCGPKSSH